MTARYDEFRTVGGELQRPIRARWWDRPKVVTIEDDWLVWKVETGERRVRSTRVPLEAFLRIATSDEAFIADFAQKWGMLQLCEHDFPAGHPTMYWPSRPATDLRYCGWRGSLTDERRESLAAWRDWAHRAIATLDVAAHLRSGRLPSTATWRTLEGLPHYVPDEDAGPQPRRTIGASPTRCATIRRLSSTTST
jgi:hypothetical protein